MLSQMGSPRDGLAELNAILERTRDGSSTLSDAARSEAHLLAGDFYTDLHEREKARSEYDAALRAGPQNGEAAFKLARALRVLGKVEPAMTLAGRALTLGGDSSRYAADATLLVGDAQRELKHPAEALKAYRKYLEIAPPDAASRAEAARQIQRLGSKDE